MEPHENSGAEKADSAVVFVVDDDEPSRDAICLLLSIKLGVETTAFASAEEFLASYEPSVAGCLVTDFKMTGMSGLDLQKQMLQRGMSIPMIFVSGYADVNTTVQAMRNGALTLLEKPLDEKELITAVQEAIKVDRSRRNVKTQRRRARERLSRLVPQELDVAKMVIAGMSNKQISSTLDVSLRTIERRRQSIFTKTKTASAVELAEIFRLAENSAD